MSGTECVYVCVRKLDSDYKNATLLNCPKIQEELCFTDFLSEVAVSHVLEDKNHAPSPVLLLVVFIYPIVPLDVVSQARFYVVILSTNPFRGFESDSSNNSYYSVHLILKAFCQNTCPNAVLTSSLLLVFQSICNARRG